MGERLDTTGEGSSQKSDWKQGARLGAVPWQEGLKQQPSCGQAHSFDDVSDVKSFIDRQLQSTLHEDLALRKRNFKFLSARWHPDKHISGDVVLATEVFQHIQEQKSWYLE